MAAGSRSGPDQRRDRTEHGGVGEDERGRGQQRDDVDLGDGEHAEHVSDRDRRHQRTLDEISSDDQPATVTAIGNRAGDEPEERGTARLGSRRAHRSAPRIR